MLFFTALLTASISSIPYIDVGLDQKLALPKDSFLLQWFKDMNEYLHTGPPVYFVVKEGYNYENIGNQNKVCHDNTNRFFVVIRALFFSTKTLL